MAKGRKFIKGRPGYVYVIKSEAPLPARMNGSFLVVDGIFKIGCCESWWKRRRNGFPGAAWPWHLVYLFKTDDHFGLEREMHEMFGRTRLKKEWFELTAYDLEWLAEHPERVEREG